MSAGTTDEPIGVDGCGCATCRCIRQERTIADLIARRDKWEEAAGTWKAAHADELDRRREAEGHRDRLVEDIRGLRAEVQRLKAEADNAVRVAFERGRHMAELLAERGEMRRAIRASAAPLRPYIGD